MTTHLICSLDSLPEHGTKGLEVGAENIFVVRDERGVSVYRNHCPHLGTPLEFMPDRFLSIDKEWIMCSTHGALFDKHTGHCISGPCQGQYLEKLESFVCDGKLYLTEGAAV